jgi:hypothetical protein
MQTDVPDSSHFPAWGAMGLQTACYPCFLRQARLALDAAGVPEADPLRHRVMKAVLEDIAEADPAKSPVHASTPLHRRIRRMLGADPFCELKSRYNALALARWDACRAEIASSSDPLATAARLAIAGNVIDFGIYREVDIDATVRRALAEPLGVDHIERFRAAASSAARVLYLLDNAGEAVFDMHLIQLLLAMGKQVTAVVRGGPIINDVTMDDARAIGLDRLCRVIDNGTDAVGTPLESVSEELRAEFEQPETLIVSKGQGNFETLLHVRREVFFLFQAKCEVVAGMLGLPEGAMLLAASPAHVEAPA